jgi:hypothetical protein
VYLPSRKLAIEFNGLYWHSEVGGKKNRIYHVNKTKLAELRGVRLIHIFEDEWIEKKDLVKNYLVRLTSPSVRKIKPTKLVVAEISKQDHQLFSEANCLYTREKSVNLRIGVFYKNELIAASSFRKTPTDDEYEMTSLSFLPGYDSSTLLGKMMDYFISRQNSAAKISYYDDRRWNINETSLTKYGFRRVAVTPPDYWNLDSVYKHRFHRCTLTKSIVSELVGNYNPSISKWKNLKTNGYDRIWDCGLIRYEIVMDQPE